MNLARRGLRNLDDGNHRITDPAELAVVRRQARKVYLESLLAAAAITVLALAIPI